MIKKIAAIITAIALWWLSIRFSVAGFNIQVPDLVWAGWVLGIAVTVIELIFTSENRGRNKTLVALGILAYAYGIWSNAVGIYAARGGGEGLNVVLVTSLGLGLLLEIAPEPLFIWAIMGGDTDEGDIVSSLGALFGDFTKRGPGRPKISRFPLVSMPDTTRKPKIKPVDTVLSRPKPDKYLAASRLEIVSALNQGSRLYWNKNQTRSPILLDAENGHVAVSPSLVRQMVEEKTLIEKKGGMVVEYTLSGAEPPLIKPTFL